MSAVLTAVVLLIQHLITVKTGLGLTVLKTASLGCMHSVIIWKKAEGLSCVLRMAFPGTVRFPCGFQNNL